MKRYRRCYTWNKLIHLISPLFRFQLVADRYSIVSAVNILCETHYGQDGRYEMKWPVQLRIRMVKT